MNFLAQSLFPFTLLQTCIDRCFETCVNNNSLSINGFTTLIRVRFTQCVNLIVVLHQEKIKSKEELSTLNHYRFTVKGSVG